MPHFLVKATCLLLAFFSISIYAETIRKEDVPARVFDYIYNKYPDAKNITVEEKIHFGQNLLEVKFIANQKDLNDKIYQDNLIDFFRMDGHFYTNAVTMQLNSFNIIPTATIKSLESHYPKYEILAIQTISNPNSVGEEYEIDMLVSGKLMNITTDDQGIISETKMEE